jgi:glycosyltransferase involved in cell wall biosynthesis
LSVSVIICAFSTERLELLRRSLDSVRAQLHAGDQLILVIDYNEALMAQVQGWSEATVIANQFERGLSGARNTGIAAATGEILAFVDDDAAVGPGWLQSARAHYRDPDVSAVGGHAEPVWPDRRPAWFPDEFDWVVGCSHRGLPTSITPVRNVIGCNMTFRRSAVQGLGGFSSRVGRVGELPMGCEETELCIRLAQSAPASRILLDPTIMLHHTVSKDRVRLRYFVRRCFAEGASKQMVSAMVGADAALSTERRYVTRVLPAGVLRGIRGALTGPQRREHLARATMILIGLAVTTLGYATTTARSGLSARRLT